MKTYDDNDYAKLVLVNIKRYDGLVALNTQYD